MLNDKQFIDPPSECRGMPFWSLNDTLDPLEMARQVEEFHRAGMGGFFPAFADRIDYGISGG